MKIRHIPIYFSLLLTACIDPSKADNKADIVKNMAKGITKKFKNVPQVSIEEYLQKKDDYILLDVRSQAEIDVSMIKGAITIEKFNKNSKAYEGKKLLTYCTIGYRSSKVAKDLMTKGWKASNLEESILGWAHRDGELINKDGPTKKVHVYGEAWNFLPKGYIGIYND